MTNLYTVQAVARAVGVSDRKTYSVLRGKGGDYLLANHETVLSPPEAIAVAAVLILGATLKPSQRQVILQDVVANRNFRTFAFGPAAGLIRLVVPADGLDPFLAHQAQWNAVSIDLGALGVGLFAELERLVDANPKWALRHSSAAGAEWAPPAKTLEAKSKRAAKKLVGQTLRDLVENG